MKHNIIYRVSYQVTPKGGKWDIKDYTCIERKAVYVINQESNFGGKTTRLPKNSILELDSMTNKRPDIIQMYTYCFKDDIETAQCKIIQKVQEVSHSYRDEILAIIKNIGQSIGLM